MSTILPGLGMEIWLGEHGESMSLKRGVVAHGIQVLNGNNPSLWKEEEEEPKMVWQCRGPLTDGATEPL